MYKELLVALTTLYFLGSCSPGVQNVELGQIDSSEVNESQLVLSSFPKKLTAIDDSLCMMITNNSTLSKYNSYTGNNITNYSTAGLSFDSLIMETYGKKYEGRRLYIYDSSSAGGLTNAYCQFQNYYADGNRVYLYVNAQVQVEYTNDTSANKEISSNEKIKAIKQKYSKAKFMYMDFVEFLFVLNSSLQLEKIIPLYQNEALTTQGYSPLYPIAFAVENDFIYTLILPKNEGYTDYKTKFASKKRFYTVAKINLKNANEVKLLAGNSTVDYKDFTLKNYYTVPRSFMNTDEGKFFLTGKQILDIDHSEVIFDNSKLAANEWIGNFIAEDHAIMLITYRTSPKMRPTDFDIAYAVDSIHSIKFRFYDRQLKKFSYTKTLNTNNHHLALAANRLLFLKKNSEHYYFMTVPYDKE